jgi:type II secretory pathway pseudopilin PulG
MRRMNSLSRIVRRSRPALRSAFSLIEVLLAVFILALGLLGLGAMVPVVIREQRDAADATLGMIAASSAEVYLKNRPDLNRYTDDQGGNQPTAMGWGVWYRRTIWSQDYAWETTPKGFKDMHAPDEDDEPGFAFNTLTGRMRIQQEANSTATPCFIRVQDRLWPDAAAGGSQPRFVWDFVGRRLPLAAGQPQQIQMAVFVRRIDPNIRVPVGRTLYQVLTQALPEEQWRVPVGVVANKPAGQRQPTLDGTGEYSRLFKVAVDYNSNYPNRLSLYDNIAEMNWKLFSRPGQKLVDNIGNVYTVIRVHDADTETVEIDPPVPSWIANSVHSLPDPTDPEYVGACSSLRSVILAPQVPAAVSVFTVEVEDLDQNPSGSGAGDVSP